MNSNEVIVIYKLLYSQLNVWGTKKGCNIDSLFGKGLGLVFILSSSSSLSLSDPLPFSYGTHAAGRAPQKDFEILQNCLLLL